MALYRQKNFFNRWKHKSLQEVIKPANGQSASARRTGQAYPGRSSASRPNSVSISQGRQPSFRENIALRETVDSVSTYSTPTRGSKRSREFNASAASPAGSRYSWAGTRPR